MELPRQEVGGEATGVEVVGRDGRELRVVVFAPDAVVVRADDRDVVGAGEARLRAGLRHALGGLVVRRQDGAGARKLRQPAREMPAKGQQVRA